MKAIIRIFAFLGFISIGGLFVSIIGGLAGSAADADILAPFSAVWAPEQGLYGVMPMIASTLVTALLAVLMALPLAAGILGCIWIFNNRLTHSLRWLVRFMSGIPTVVYSFCGLFILVPFFRQLWGGSGYNVLTVSVALCFLILPTVVIVADSALYPLMSKPQGLTLTTSALGMTRTAAFMRAALYIQRKWLVTAVLLGFSRALGDTMVALMLSGNVPLAPSGILEPVRTLSGHISLLAATEINAQVQYTLFLSGFLLFAAALGVNLCATVLRKRQ